MKSYEATAKGYEEELCESPSLCANCYEDLADFFPNECAETNLGTICSDCRQGFRPVIEGMEIYG
jgi:hypothetical protein